MKKTIFPLLAFLLLLQACNLPSGAPVTPTLTTPSLAPGSPTFAPTITDTPAPTATPQNPLVLRDTLCWVGPGPQYDVVSALKTNTRVELIGRGTVTGWWVVTNPIYKDACWVKAADVQIEPGFDTSTLKLINPPPTPTPTPSQTPTPTPTP
jgi:uncharacterized protein YgiM (DUF1202 family)